MPTSANLGEQLKDQVCTSWIYIEETLNKIVKNTQGKDIVQGSCEQFPDILNALDYRGINVAIFVPLLSLYGLTEYVSRKCMWRGYFGLHVLQFLSEFSDLCIRCCLS